WIPPSSSTLTGPTAFTGGSIRNRSTTCNRGRRSCFSYAHKKDRCGYQIHTAVCRSYSGSPFKDRDQACPYLIDPLSVCGRKSKQSFILTQLQILTDQR